MESKKASQHRALILGFWGSSSRSLYRYETLHTQLGAEKVVVIPCSTDTMMGRGKDGWDASLKMTQLFQDLEETDSRVVVHLFSNGGLFIYLRFFERNPRYRTNVAAVVFDSTPGYLNFITGTNAVLANHPEWKPIAYGVAFLAFASLLRKLWKSTRPLQHSLLLTMLYLIASAWSAHRDRQYHNRVIADPMTAPSLYIYSKADRLVDYRVVEKVYKGRSAFKPMIKCFEDSHHVAHCKTHTEAYAAAVQQLLKVALNT